MRRALVCGSLLFFLAPAASATSPWLPEQGGAHVSAITVYEQFSSFFMGKKKSAFPPGKYQQVTALGSVQYGVLDWMAFDVTLGYVRGLEIPGALAVNDGLYDTDLGLTVKLYDEFASDLEWAPSVALRIGGIIAGTYDANGALFPAIPGDKASGVDGELALGKSFANGLGFTTIFGGRWRNKDVPADWHVRVATFASLPLDQVSFLDSLNFSLAYDQRESVSGIDIGGPGWNPNRFRELDEDYQNVEFSVGLRDSGKRNYEFFYAKTVDGRNTGLKDIVGFVLTQSF